MRFFNTEGPIRRDRHYHIPPLDRVNLDDLLGLVRDERYFVLHAPRQTGKTSALLALRDLLNAGSDYRCVYVTVEAGQAARENVADAMRVILYELESEEQATLGSNTLADVWPGALERAGPLGALRASLARWCRADPQPLVLLIDEIDTLVGDTLLSVLRQLRAGYPDRPGRFPHSVILCGVRDVRDYRIYSTARNALDLGGSAFNIKSKSLRLGDFTEAETRALLAQHTEETGQPFTADARAAVWTRTAGQPWLVNALCREACFENQPGRDRSRAITEGDILDAQERLIRSAPSKRDWPRRAATWTGAVQRQATWSSSTTGRTGRGRRRSSAAMRRLTLVAGSPSGACECRQDETCSAALGRVRGSASMRKAAAPASSLSGRGGAP